MTKMKTVAISTIGLLGVSLGLAFSVGATTRWHSRFADTGHDASPTQACAFRSLSQTPAIGCTSASVLGTYAWQIPLQTIWEGPAAAVTLNASGVAWVPNVNPPVPSTHTVQGRLITWNGALGLSCSTAIQTWALAAAPSSKNLGSCANFQPHAQHAEAEFFVGNGMATSPSQRARVHSSGFTYEF